MKKYKMIASIALMIVIDQLIKIIIKLNFMKCELGVDSWFGFRPHLNTEQMSILNNEFNLDLNHYVIIIIEIILLIIFLFSYLYMNKKYGDIKLLHILYGLLFAGGLCSLIDLTFWGGSLDYILLFSQIVDLKDIYLFVGAIVFFVLSIFMTIKEYKEKCRSK